MESRAFIVGLIVGILATVTMDAVIAVRLGIAGWGPRRTGPDLIGRWIGYLLRGKCSRKGNWRESAPQPPWTLYDIYCLMLCSVDTTSHVISINVSITRLYGTELA
jgi:hypothetical protein